MSTIYKITATTENISLLIYAGNITRHLSDNWWWTAQEAEKRIPHFKRFIAEFHCERIMSQITFSVTACEEQEIAGVNAQPPRRNRDSKMEQIMTTYYITCPGNTNNWEKTNAKTLSAAKTLASKTWQVTTGSKLIVAAKDQPDGQLYELAVKYGYDKWVNV